MNTEFYTYIYYDPSRGNEPIYVGKGKDRRAWDHINTLHRKKKHPLKHRLLFMRSIGTAPIIGIYARFDEEFALFLEEELIAKFGRKDLGLGPLLNLTNGGEGHSGCIRTAETRKKIGIANMGKDRTHTVKSKDKISESCLGRKDTPAAKEKKSRANMGELNNNVKLDKNMVKEIFLSNSSLDELSVIYGVSTSHIWSIKARKYWKSLTADL